jgi:uncharacterized iron-regulated protein
MPASPREELITVHRKLWRRNREIIDSSILVKEPGFDRYEAAYDRAVRKYSALSNQSEMVRAVLKSDIIYVGDYHTCNQSQRSFLRILKAVVKRDKDFMVGLELLHAKHQSTLDKYLSGQINEETLLKRIKLQEHWIFDLWENFKPLFDFCKYHGVPIYALEAASQGASLNKRDRETAKLVVKILRDKPDKKFFVFIGDLHIAPPHLPTDVDDELDKLGVEIRDLILFENSESIYWKLAKEGLEDRVEVVRIDDRSFCRMHTPPVVCQRSYLNWLEHEEGEIDYADAKHDFLELTDRICEFLRIDLGKKRDSVEVFTCGDLSFLKRLRESKHFTKSEMSAIKQQILASESYYIAKARFVYLANLSVNHGAEEAAHFIKHVKSGPEHPRELIDAFYANILHEALGFFGSKLINHKRKCHHERDFKNLLEFFEMTPADAERMIEYETAHLVLEYKKYERKKQPLKYEEIFHARMDLFNSVTHAMGYMLGDRMYYGLMARKITRKTVRQLFLDPWEEEGRPYEVYMDLIKRLRGVKIPKRM